MKSIALDASITPLKNLRKIVATQLQQFYIGHSFVYQSPEITMVGTLMQKANFTGRLQAATKPEQSDLFWAFVTSFGALWGTMEITLGAFLHTMRFPFAGILLSALSAALLVGERQLLPCRGVSLATGVVAALCKSISPGGIILGPMIAIIVEALLVELALLLAPRAMISALLAGALCAIWSAFQQLLTQYIFYGVRLIDLYLAALRKAGDWLGLSSQAGWWTLAILVGVIALIGSLGGLFGRRIGIDSSTRLSSTRTEVGPS